MMEVIQIPKSISKSDRKLLAEDVIEFIVERTTNGIDKNGKDFPKYTKQYAKKKGVDVRAVDLVASGEMLLAEKLKKISDKQGEIVIGYDARSKQLNDKVEGNILGSYGGEPNPKKARDFLGISRKDLMVITARYTDED